MNTQILEQTLAGIKWPQGTKIYPWADTTLIKEKLVNGYRILPPIPNGYIIIATTTTATIHLVYVGTIPLGIRTTHNYTNPNTSPVNYVTPNTRWEYTTIQIIVELSDPQCFLKANEIISNYNKCLLSGQPESWLTMTTSDILKTYK